MKYTVFLVFFLFTFQFHFIYAQTSVLGSAQSLGEGCYQLTEAVSTQNGAVWFEDQINLNNDFDINLVMNFGNDDGGADGMCFVLQNNSLTEQGIGGGGVGYLDIPNSVCVEFDIWQNAEVGDLVSDHIGMNSNGTNTHNLAGPIQADLNSNNIEDGEDHDIRIKWTASINLLEVFFDCEFRLSATQDIINTSFGGNNMVYWGFVASTGGASNNQTVCMNSGIGEPAIFTTCTGAPVELNIGDIDILQPIIWSPADFLSSTSVASPISSTTENITYSVDYTHICGYEATSEVAVVIDELIVFPLNVPSISCGLEPILIQAGTNYEDVNVEWSTENGNITNLNGLTVEADTLGQYTVDVNYQELCFDSYTFDVGIDTSGISVEITQQMALDCINDQIVLGANVGATGAAFEWSTDDGIFENGTETLSPVISSGGTYMLYVELDEMCTGEGEITIIDPDSLELINQDSYLISCDMTTLSLDVTTNYPDMEFSWDDSDGNILQNENTLTPEVSEGGDYILTANYGSCEDELIVTVEEDTDAYEVDLFLFVEPTCLNNTALIEVNITPNDMPMEDFISTEWSTSDGVLFDTGEIGLGAGEAGGTYSVEVENLSNGCLSEAEIVIEELAPFSLDVPETVLLTCQNPVANISALVQDELSNYLFTWNNGFSEEEGIGLNVYSSSEQSFIDLTVEYGDCIQTEEISVDVSPNFNIDLSSLDAPNVFTPNADEMNSLFIPIVKTDVTFDVIPFLEDYKMTIYSRWGTELFSTTNGGWDGKVDGELLATGVYYYIITFDSVCGDSANGELRGTVTLLD